MNYPLRVLSLGAGVQSTTLLLMILEGELEPVDHIIFADTGYEPEPVYQHLAYLKTLIDAAGIPFHLVSNGNIREETLDPTKRAASMPFFTMNQDGSKGMVLSESHLAVVSRCATDDQTEQHLPIRLAWCHAVCAIHHLI